MLRTKKRVSLTGESVIGDKVVCIYTASINPDAPNGTAIGQVQREKDLYRAHVAECRADYAAFEDLVWKTEEELKKG